MKRSTLLHKYGYIGHSDEGADEYTSGVVERYIQGLLEISGSH